VDNQPIFNWSDEVTDWPHQQGTTGQIGHFFAARQTDNEVIVILLELGVLFTVYSNY